MDIQHNVGIYRNIPKSKRANVARVTTHTRVNNGRSGKWVLWQDSKGVFHLERYAMRISKGLNSLAGALQSFDSYPVGLLPKLNKSNYIN